MHLILHEHACISGPVEVARIKLGDARERGYSSVELAWSDYKTRGGSDRIEGARALSFEEPRDMQRDAVS